MRTVYTVFILFYIAAYCRQKPYYARLSVDDLANLNHRSCDIFRPAFPPNASVLLPRIDRPERRRMCWERTWRWLARS
ncbi:hypothetical protein HMPREF0185_03183 [Brevundimonas diminuta 470-4]|nr:hypothetical protein HMPREF0185_03183 [Brevundimonas diminuta 470-4]